MKKGSNNGSIVKSALPLQPQDLQKALTSLACYLGILPRPASALAAPVQPEATVADTGSANRLVSEKALTRGEQQKMGVQARGSCSPLPTASLSLIMRLHSLALLV